MNAHSEVTERLKGFDQFIDEQLSEWQVPGLAVGVIYRGEVVWARGYGYRDRQNQLPVTAETVFPIGSATKAFTTMALGMLVDEKKLAWDRPVREYMPWFKLYDPVVTERITSRDLATHRSGLPRHEFFWFNSSASRRELVERMRYLEPYKDFRTSFWYQNLTYLIAGELVREVAGLSWEEFVQNRILQALGMSDSSISFEKFMGMENRSLAYAVEEGVSKEIPYMQLDILGPAGAINSSLRDMLKWVQVHLAGGKYGGEQLVSQENLAQMHSPQVIIPEPLKHKETPHAMYGLGWRVIPYRGYNVVRHGGNVTGFASQVSFLPQEQIGVVVLSNKDGNEMLVNVLYNLYDRLLGLEIIDWNARLREQVAEMRRKQEERKQKNLTDRKLGTRPSHTLTDYVGVYDHPGYGKVAIAREGERLTITYNDLTFPLTHYHYDLFEYEFPLWKLTMKVNFLTDVKGEVGSVAIPFDGSVQEIVFKRVRGS